MAVFRRLKTTAEDVAARFQGSTGVDNSLLRRDGTGKNLQDSAAYVDDDGTLHCLTTIKPNIALTYTPFVTISGTAGDCRHLILTGNATLRFPDWRVGQSLELRLIQDEVGGWGVLWDAVIYWPGFEPGLTETPGHWDVICLRCFEVADGVPKFEGFVCGYNFGELVVQVDCEENGGMGVCCIDGVCHEISCVACVAAGGTWMTGIAECEFGCGDCCE